MAQRDDELNKRQRQRAAAQKKRRKEQMMLRRRLTVAVMVLILCGLSIWALTRDIPRDQAEAEVPETTQYTEEATRPREEPTTTIHIKAAGDLNVTDAVVNAGLTSLGYDFTEAFLDVAPLLADADLTMMNFEGNLVGEPYGTLRASAPQQLVDALNAMGVDLLQMANSYSIHNGMIGLSQTLNNIRAAGIEPVGAFSTPEEFASSKGFTMCNVRGISVAVVAFTKGMDGLGLPSGSEDCVNLLFTDYDTTYSEIDKDGIRSVLRAAQAEKPDVTIALLHWGSSYNDIIFEVQEDIVSLMKKEGVDIILGTHPHLLHEIAFDDVGNTLIAYSLGDFFGDAEKGGTNYSIILDIEITKDNEAGVTEIVGYSVTPIYTLKEGETKDSQRRVVRIRDTMAAYDVNFVDKVTKDAYDSMTNSLERIEARIHPNAEKQEEE